MFLYLTVFVLFLLCSFLVAHKAESFFSFEAPPEQKYDIVGSKTLFPKSGLSLHACFFPLAPRYLKVPIPLKNPKYKLVIVAIFKNEARFLKEWIEYYLMLGVEHFYLGNNHSTDKWEKVLHPYIKRGIVTIEDISHKNHFIRQERFNNGKIKELAQETEWVLICDTDEFFIPLKDPSIPKMLERFQDCASVSFNWRVFSTSNVQKIPSNKTLVETLTHCGEPNATEIKTFCRPRYVLKHFNHWVQCAQGYRSIMEDGKPQPFCHESTRHSERWGLFNHYRWRDRHFFESIKAEWILTEYNHKTCPTQQRKRFLKKHYAWQRRHFFWCQGHIQPLINPLRLRLGLATYPQKMTPADPQNS